MKALHLLPLFLLTSTLPVVAQSQPTLFRDREFSVDLFGSVSVGQETLDDLTGERFTDDGRLGAGVGLNYYLLRYVGIGADAYTENTARTFVDNASGNLLLRFPIESAHLAPYIFGGGGRQFDPDELWFGQVGGGLDVRITAHVALFADVRYVMPEKDAENFGVGRLGLRIPF